MQRVVDVKEYNGVRGWLLLLCILLTLLIPVKSICYLVYDYVRFWPHFGTYPGLITPSIIYTALALGMIGLSIYAGIALWRISSGAVFTAKTFLLVYAGSSLLDIILLMLFPTFTGLPFQRRALICRIS